MLLLHAGHAASPPAATHVQVRSTVSVRIERSVTASRKEWERAPKASRREIVVRDERGNPLLVRLIEYQ